MSELKACPFCNAEPLYYDGIVGADHKLNCPLYQMSIPVIEWESRPIEKALQKGIVELRQNLLNARELLGIEMIALNELTALRQNLKSAKNEMVEQCEIDGACDFLYILRKYNLIQEE